MNRPLTQDERGMLINAVQGLVGRIDRNVGSDARRAAYHEVVALLQREFHLRFPPEETTYQRSLAPPPDVRELPLRTIQVPPRAQPQSYDLAPRRTEFDPFA